MKQYFFLFIVIFMGLSPTACGQANDELPNIKSILHRGSASDMAEGLKIIFPEGTSRDYVHRVLVEKGGVTYEGQMDNVFNENFTRNAHQYRYQKPVYLRFIHNVKYLITIFYDGNDKHLTDIIPTESGHQTREWYPAILISGPTDYNTSPNYQGEK